MWKITKSLVCFRKIPTVKIPRQNELLGCRCRISLGGINNLNVTNKSYSSRAKPITRTRINPTTKNALHFACVAGAAIAATFLYRHLNKRRLLCQALKENPDLPKAFISLTDATEKSRDLVQRVKVIAINYKKNLHFSSVLKIC